jgi:hypothetical protein
MSNAINPTGHRHSVSHGASSQKAPSSSTTEKTSSLKFSDFKSDGSTVNTYYANDKYYDESAIQEAIELMKKNNADDAEITALESLMHSLKTGSEFSGKQSDLDNAFSSLDSLVAYEIRTDGFLSRLKALFQQVIDAYK